MDRLPPKLGLAAATMAVGLALAGCGSGSGHAAATTTTRPVVRPTTPTTKKTAPPTTAWKPSAPQPTPDDAAALLIQDWAAGNRAGARHVAAPVAVTTLFAAAYPGSGLAIPRGCSAGFPPIVCTYGPPGGGPVTAAIYELTMAQSAKGWYTASVRVEG